MRTRPRLRRSALVLCLGALCLGGAPRFARADTIDATITTLLSGRQDARDGQLHTVVPVYQSLTLVARLKVPYVEDLRIAVSGWGGVDLASPAPMGDVDVALVEGRVLWRRVDLRVGRQIIAGGAARVTPLDGALATVHFGRGFGLSLYGGAPVTPRFATSRGDVAGGGRVFYRGSYESEIGASFIHVLGAGRVARQDVALDARYRPHRMVTLTGFGLLSTRELRLGEAQIAVTIEPHRMIQVGVDYRRTAPDLFLPLNSILSVFSQESRDELGAAVYLRPHARVRLDGDYRLVLDASGTGHRGGGRLTALAGNTTLGTDLRVLSLPPSAVSGRGGTGYVQARLFAAQRLRSLLLTVDADTYVLHQPINGQSVSFTAAATGAWDFAENWRVALTGMADVTPFVERRFECVARLVYNHTVRFREVLP